MQQNDILFVSAKFKTEKCLPYSNRFKTTSESPSRQLLETVNFAFMKIFDFLVKIAVFRASLFFREIPVMHFFPDHVFDCGRKA